MPDRPVPAYVEKAMFSLRENEEYIKWLTETYPDTLRWISYRIDTTLANMRSAEIQELQGLDDVLPDGQTVGNLLAASRLKRG